MKITFNSKETYIQWRTQWRKQYAELSETIRQCKRDGDRSGREFYRIKAREMIEVRRESKRVAQAQYLAAKAALSASLAPELVVSGPAQPLGLPRNESTPE